MLAEQKEGTDNFLQQGIVIKDQLQKHSWKT